MCKMFIVANATTPFTRAHEPLCTIKNDIKRFISTLEESSQYDLALTLTNKTITIWDEYARTNKLEYVDTVVGMHHKVKKDILSRTLSTIKQELLNPKSQQNKIRQLREEFSDPIVAMQDLDWELSPPVELTFYATQNLLDKINGEETTIFDEPQIYVVINQAIDALSQSNLMIDTEIKELLKKYKNERTSNN